MILLLSPLLAALAVASAATVDFAVVLDRRIPPEAVSLEVRGQWLGEPYTVALTDADGVMGDGIWSGRASGDTVRMLPVTLQMQVNGTTPVTLASTTELMDVDGGRITWGLSGDPRDGRVRARRVALASSPRRMERFETASTAAGLGWFVLVFLYVAWWSMERRSGGRTRRRGRP